MRKLTARFILKINKTVIKLNLLIVAFSEVVYFGGKTFSCAAADSITDIVSLQRTEGACT